MPGCDESKHACSCGKEGHQHSEVREVENGETEEHGDNDDDHIQHNQPASKQWEYRFIKRQFKRLRLNPSIELSVSARSAEFTQQ